MPPKSFPRLLIALPVLLMLVLAGLFWRGLAIDPNSLPSPLLGKPLPAFSLPALSDPARTIAARDWQGPALVNVWASWCVACRDENPLLLALAAEGVAIYGVDYLDLASDARDWLRLWGNPFRDIVFDAEGRLGQALGLDGAPTTYLLDGRGTIVYRHVGALNEAEIGIIRAKLAAALAP